MLLLEQKMSEDVRMEEIAQAFNLSLHHFHRLFVAETGEAPASYLRRIRLEAAALQLERSALPAGGIGLTRGYNSQAAFTRAFQNQFGAPPQQYRRQNVPERQPDDDRCNISKVAIKEVESFRVLAKRFVGDVWKLPEYWDTFLNALPRSADTGSALYLGLLHDTPGVTQSTRTGYDCCVTLSPNVEFTAKALAGSGMFIMQSRAGLYAELAHAGPAQRIPATYGTLCNRWLPRSSFHATGDPIVELHEIAPNQQDPAHRVFKILLPIE